jgi:hypothetical protein
VQRDEAQAKLAEALAASDAVQADNSTAAAAARDAEATVMSSTLLQQMKQAEFNMGRFALAKAAHGGFSVVSTNSLFVVTHV